MSAQLRILLSGSSSPILSNEGNPLTNILRWSSLTSASTSCVLRALLAHISGHLVNSYWPFHQLIFGLCLYKYKYRFASLYVTRLLFSTKTLSTKFMVASESTKASVCTFLLYTQSVTGILKEVVLLCAILLQNSSTTSDFCKLIGGIHFSGCRSQTLYSIVPRENPIWKSPFLSHLEE